MPATVTDGPLGIACVFSDGSAATFSLDGLPCPALARDLLDGLADLIHPHGTVDTAGSVTHYVQSVRDMTRKLAARGFTGGAPDLRRPLAAEYWLAATGPREACTRRMLQAITARLDPQVAELAAGRAYNPQRNHRALPPYPEDDWDRLAGACRAIADESFAAHKRALDAAAGGQHPASGGWTPANLRWLLARTGPVSSAQFGEMLGCTRSAVAFHLVSAIGPHVSGLLQEVAEADRRWSSSAPGLSHAGRVPEKEFPALLDDYERNGRALPLLPAHHLQDRLKSGWSPDDPLAPLALSLLARQAGFTQFPLRWIPALRDGIEATLSVVGADKPFARGAAPVARADADATIPWTLPLDRLEATGLAGVVRTAAIITLAAVSGMRSSELMELRVGCCRPPESHGPGLVRYRLAGTIIKGQPLGGLADEWVVIEPAYQAARLLEQLHGNPEDGVPLLGRFAFDVRYAWFRNWVNSPAGQRHGLAPIPDGPVTLRALRRTLSLELAYRPGGLLAAKLHLKHIAVATTEGYASRPGGAQAELLAEVNKHEAERNLELVWAEFRNYQQGIMPAGPGARELAEFFAHIDGKLAAGDPGAPKTQASDRDVLNLMTKRAQALHLGTSNYCWFTDPSRALCLKLAGDPAAGKPLIGMCDSARCPQATHHPCHRPVWAEHAENTKTFLGQLGPTRKTERKRLQAEYDRAARVLARIDEAAGEAE